jgi:hypothetical protein
MPMPLFSQTDVLHLADESSLQVVVKDDVFCDIANGILSELQALVAMDGVLRPAKMGKADTRWEDAGYRGDRLCWITPNLCSENKFEALPIFIRRMISECKVFKHHPDFMLNGDYSVQFAHYVSALRRFENA